ncbi:MAG: hypothetical protein NTV63_03310 [Candidatus Woesearchaeota archaeon]|nr:hypothetical protein [Candidatus Woesearchaeota archaeon]
MKGLSDKEIGIVSFLEFEQKYFFSKKDIKNFFSTKNQVRHTIHKLLKKERIISLNKRKYYLVPIKAKSGKWSENSFMMADEVMDGKNYFIGGWAAANYWRLTDQVPMKIEVYTTKRQGTKRFLTTTIIFRRTTEKRLKQAIKAEVNGHEFKILNKIESEKWMKSRS